MMTAIFNPFSEAVDVAQVTAHIVGLVVRLRRCRPGYGVSLLLEPAAARCLGRVGLRRDATGTRLSNTV